MVIEVNFIREIYIYIYIFGLTIKRKENLVTMRGVVQPVRYWICSLEITGSNPTNLRVTRGLHDR
jgi:hypothetical protein